MRFLCFIAINLLAAGIALVPDYDAWADASVQDRLDEAEQIYRQDGPDRALPLFEQLVTELQTGGDIARQGIAVGFVGEIHWRLGNYTQAGEWLDRALVLKRQADDRLQQGKTLNVLGLLNWDLGNYDQAKAYFKQGTDIAEDVGDKRLAGAILNNLSLVHDELGDYHVSLQQYTRVLELYNGVDFPRGEGDTLGNIGGVHLILGHFEVALGYYKKALVISEQLESKPSMSQDHGNLALCYLGLGNADTAMEHFELAISLSAETGMRQDEAFWLRGKGNALIRKGLYNKGLESHRAALAIYQQLDGKTELIEALHNMGELNLLLGDARSAGDYFQQAIKLAREIGLSRGITISLIAMGELQERQGLFEEAAALYRQAVQRAKETGEMSNWSLGLLHLARTHQAQKRFDEAVDETGRALEIAREIGAVGLQAQAFYIQAEGHRLRGHNEESLAGFAQTLDTLNKAPGSDLKWRALYGQGLAYAETDNKAAAITSLKSAITLIEGVRNRLREERYRAGYVQDKYQVYVDLVRLQLATGQQEDAFSTAERLRSKSYLDLIESEIIPETSVADQRTEFALRERIRQLRKALVEETNLALPEQRQVAIGVFSRELLAAEQEYQALLDDRRQKDPARQMGHTVPTYADVRQKLLADEALVEYVVGSDEIMFFVLTRESLFAETSSLRREDLQNKVELLRNLIRRQDSDRWKKPALSLTKTLLSPIMASGQLDGVRHLYLVPHGILNYLPFALLPGVGQEKSSLMVEEFTLAYLPTAAALLRESRALKGNVSMLAVAPQRSHLRHAQAEARAVNALYQPDSRVLLGKSATESTFKSIAADYRLLHLATHGYFNKLNPLLSGLELEPDETNDGQLELHEILGMQLDADLVTLSACQTGLGSGYFAAVPAGDDFVGLTRAFLYAGSTSVLATLWEVDDRSTVDLMKSFYTHLEESGVRNDKAVALAYAQRSLRSSEKYQHPYYWAPFVLVGALNKQHRNGLAIGARL
jgi:CHAT domain-containing protein/Tfp pilus assembly protein PilF